jgi:hypothetical protein
MSDPGQSARRGRGRAAACAVMALDRGRTDPEDHQNGGWIGFWSKEAASSKDPGHYCVFDQCGSAEALRHWSRTNSGTRRHRERPKTRRSCRTEALNDSLSL